MLCSALFRVCSPPSRALGHPALRRQTTRDRIQRSAAIAAL